MQWFFTKGSSVDWQGRICLVFGMLCINFSLTCACLFADEIIWRKQQSSFCIGLSPIIIPFFEHNWKDGQQEALRRMVYYLVVGHGLMDLLLYIWLQTKMCRLSDGLDQVKLFVQEQHWCRTEFGTNPWVVLQFIVILCVGYVFVAKCTFYGRTQTAQQLNHFETGILNLLSGIWCRI